VTRRTNDERGVRGWRFLDNWDADEAVIVRSVDLALVHKEITETFTLPREIRVEPDCDEHIDVTDALKNLVVENGESQVRVTVKGSEPRARVLRPGRCPFQHKRPQVECPGKWNRRWVVTDLVIARLIFERTLDRHRVFSAKRKLRLRRTLEDNLLH
jgi:hypothetical protein